MARLPKLPFRTRPSASPTAHPAASATTHRSASVTAHPSASIHHDPGALYTQASTAAASHIIRHYSTSFYLASELLAPTVKLHIRNIYALARIADEIVDGTAEALGLPTGGVTKTLDDYGRTTLKALDTGFSTDPIAHAFATTARWAGFERSWTVDFFASMRSDAPNSSPLPLADYVHGSAGVIGWMCNAVFATHAEQAGSPLTAEQRSRTDKGAYALGSAFQKVNFLRDYQEDTVGLHRSYLPKLTEESKAELVDEIRAELAQAHTTMALLPLAARVGVLGAHDLFAALNERLARTPVEQLKTARVRVPRAEKAKIIARAVPRAASMH
ncbi:squalene/phytoene synthase family protein [Corynebacterium evansiae]|uniref:squalene/phytoene synthase family protein n=1 Tax=Corynebacterium evansiae TaxID=2913499 RepID=UPI003EBCA260